MISNLNKVRGLSSSIMHAMPFEKWDHFHSNSTYLKMTSCSQWSIYEVPPRKKKFASDLAARHHVELWV